MRTQTSHPGLLLISLMLGLMAMWAVASPVGSSGDLITGGWTWCYWGDSFACASTSCETQPCHGVTLTSCSNYNYDVCPGGYIAVTSCGPGGGSLYAYPGGGSPCGGSCFGIQNWTCY